MLILPDRSPIFMLPAMGDKIFDANPYVNEAARDGGGWD